MLVVAARALWEEPTTVTTAKALRLRITRGHERVDVPMMADYSLISRTTRRADSRAPCIHPVHAEVCSPAK